VAGQGFAPVIVRVKKHMSLKTPEIELVQVYKTLSLLANYWMDLSKSEDKVAESEELGQKRRRLAKERSAIHLEDAKTLLKVLDEFRALTQDAQDEDIRQLIAKSARQVWEMESGGQHSNSIPPESQLRHLKYALRLLAHRLNELAESDLSDLKERIRLLMRALTERQRNTSRYTGIIDLKSKAESVAEQIVSPDHYRRRFILRFIEEVEAATPDTLEWGLAKIVDTVRTGGPVGSKKKRPIAKPAAIELKLLRSSIHMFNEPSIKHDDPYMSLHFSFDSNVFGEDGSKKLDDIAWGLALNRKYCNDDLLSALLNKMRELPFNAEERHILSVVD
jgi:hypothetical protein